MKANSYDEREKMRYLLIVPINKRKKFCFMSEREEKSTPTRLTHVDESGNISMVDVTERPITERGAIARARVRMAPETAHLIETNQISKGSVLEVARIAAIMAAKQ